MRPQSTALEVIAYWFVVRLSEVEAFSAGFDFAQSDNLRLFLHRYSNRAACGLFFADSSHFSMKAPLRYALLAAAALWLTTAPACAQQPADAPAETAIRRYLPVPAGGLDLWEKRTDECPARRLKKAPRLYVQTAPDTTWFRVLVLGYSYFVRQRELPVPGWQAGTQ